MAANAFANFFMRLGDFVERLFTWKGGVKKSLEWATRRGFRIEKIEGSSAREGGFKLWASSRNSVNLKMEISDASGNRQGVYLMLNPLLDSDFAISRFVRAEELQFVNPYRLINGKLVSITREEDKNDD